jgi:hypothetical protein
MNNKVNIQRFEELMEKVKRPGMDALMNYIRKSDFYTAPASTKFHLSCEGGLLQHSLNVYDALISKFVLHLEDDGTTVYAYEISGGTADIARYPEETIILSALLHDLCKTNFYTTEYRNQKVYKKGGSKRDNGGAYDWERVPVYAIDDRNPYGHGEKSVMMASEFIRLTMDERYAIRWHMGMADEGYNGIQSFNASVEKYPLVLLLHMADQEASHFMEDKDGNRAAFADMSGAESAGEYADNPAQDEEPLFQDAAPI